MDFRNIHNSTTFSKLPKHLWQKKWVRLLAILALVLLIVAGVWAIWQANSVASSLNSQVGEARQSFKNDLAQTTLAINKAKLAETKSAKKALDLLESLQKNAHEQSLVCNDVSKPIGAFLSGAYRTAENACKEYRDAALDLEKSINSFRVHATYMTKLQTALQPVLGLESSAEVKAAPAAVVQAWTTTKDRLTALKDVPEDIKAQQAKLGDIAKTIIAETNKVSQAQASYKTDAFKKATSAVTKAYDQLHSVGSNLRGLLITDQKMLLEATSYYSLDN